MYKHKTNTWVASLENWDNSHGGARQPSHYFELVSFVSSKYALLVCHTKWLYVYIFVYYIYKAGTPTGFILSNMFLTCTCTWSYHHMTSFATVIVL